MNLDSASTQERTPTEKPDRHQRQRLNERTLLEKTRKERTKIEQRGVKRKIALHVFTLWFSYDFVKVWLNKVIGTFGCWQHRSTHSMRTLHTKPNASNVIKLKIFMLSDVAGLHQLSCPNEMQLQPAQAILPGNPHTVEVCYFVKFTHLYLCVHIHALAITHARLL